MLAAFALTGCSRSTSPTAPPADTPPSAGSAALALQRLEWGVNHGDLALIAGLLSDDFLFISAGTDSAGNPSSEIQGDRTWFLAAMDSLLHGRYGSSQVTLQIDRNLIPLPDTRPGRDPRVHKQIRTSIDLRVRDTAMGQSYEVTGNGLFFATRGDSAAIPPELLAQGVKHDSTTWWLDRLEDETLAGPEPPLPTSLSLAQLLAYYYKRVAP